MAIGPLDDIDYRNLQVGNWTIMWLGAADIQNYNHTRRLLIKALNRVPKEDKAQRELLGGMLSECNYVLEWLRTGRRPGQLRGVERRYERAWDPAWIDCYHSPSGWTLERESVSRELTADERFKIEEAMRDLSARERQCYMMHVVDGMSFGDIARELHLAKGTVQTNMERAREKIEYAKVSSLFLV